ncbi:MAG: phosphate ABC transporter permease PstA [Candidatus Abyssubacteria bacterium]
MRQRSVKARRWSDAAVKVISGGAALVGVLALGWILSVVAMRGLRAIDFDFFTKLPTPPGIPGGGLASAIMGTFAMTTLASVIGITTGLLAGVFLAEFGRDSFFAESVRTGTNILMGTPSIIIGVFVYTLLVLTTGHFSGYAGAAALAIIMFPVVARTTEDMLGLVPNELRESALAIGAPRWRMTLGIVFRAARAGLLTGILLAIARITGETAPLLFTALNSPYWPKGLGGPTANLTVTIFNYAMSPYRDWQQMAWGASFLITAGVLGVTIVARTLLREKKRTS